MFEEYYKRLRFSNKMADRSLIICMKINESNKNYVLSTMKDKTIFCHKGCNLCCHALTLTVDPLNTCILLRVLATVPYDELFPYFKSCLDNRQKAGDYLDSLPVDLNRNDNQEVYDKLGFTAASCPFVDNQNGCLIYEFRPRICFSYFSSVPCKISLISELSEEQKKRYEALKNKAEIVEFSSLENDNKVFYFNDEILGTYDRLRTHIKIIEQDQNLEYVLSHNIMYEMLTILSFALELSNPEKYENDMKGLKVDFLAYVDGEVTLF
jgi:Fe-S-cluster containining protein